MTPQPSNHQSRNYDISLSSSPISYSRHSLTSFIILCLFPLLIPSPTKFPATKTHQGSFRYTPKLASTNRREIWKSIIRPFSASSPFRMLYTGKILWIVIVAISVMRFIFFFMCVIGHNEQGSSVREICMSFSNWENWKFAR